MIKKADIPNDTVSYAKMQNAEAANVFVGNNGSAGDPLKEVTAAEASTIVGGELLLDEDDMSSDSDTKGATQQSIKAYVDAEVAGVSSDVALIETQTASSSSEIDFTTLSTDYSYFKVILQSVAPATDNTTLEIQTSTDGGSTFDTGSSDYGYVRTLGSSTTTSTFSSSGAAFIPAHASSLGNATNEVLNGEITIFNPAGTGHTNIEVKTGHINHLGDRFWSTFYAARLANEDVDAIRLAMSSGNIASGTFKLYGYK